MRRYSVDRLLDTFQTMTADQMAEFAESFEDRFGVPFPLHQLDAEPEELADCSWPDPIR